MMDLRKLIEEGKAQAMRTGRAVLISSVTEIDADPLAFFSWNEPRFAGKRFFWSDPGNHMTFVGLGRVATCEPAEQDNRFQEIERQWRQIAGNALVSAEAPACAGPLFFGGFSFDPEKPRTELWERFPHARFVVPEWMLTVEKGKSWLTVNRLVTPESEFDDSDLLDIPQRFVRPEIAAPAEGTLHQEEIDPAGWLRSVEEATDIVRSGTLKKIVLARELRLYADRPFDAAQVLARLYGVLSNTFVFAMEEGDHCLIGATPERIIQAKGSEFVTTCLAGSIARGRTEAEDQTIGRSLLQDRKNMHEHALTVQLIGETMRRLCTWVDMPDQPKLYKLKDIQHLYTPVVGRAKEGVTILQVLEALHPTPALGGLPQRESVEAIRRLEQLDRGWYAAPIGWINRRMDGEFAAAIRSALLRGKEASLFAGCGIVEDSQPLSEYQETALKFKPMLAALGAVEMKRNE